MADAAGPLSGDVTWVEAAGARVAVRRKGFGAPLLCLHATGHDGADFDDLAQRIGGLAEIIALDFPGQGDSPAEAVPASAARYGEIALAASDQLGLQRFVILGNSIGGAAGIMIAARNSERVRGLVLCNPGGLQRVSLVSKLYCRNLAARFERGARGEPAFGRWFRRYYEKTILPSPAATARREAIIDAGFVRAPVLAQAWRSFAESDADIRHLAPMLTMPVLYAWAKRDFAISWARSKRAALRAPKSEYVSFEAGHAAFLEQPDAFEAALRSFLAGLPA